MYRSVKILKTFLFTSVLSICLLGNIWGVESASNKEINSPFNTFLETINQNQHYVHVLDIGDDALLSRIHLIRSARESILIQTFIWTNDETGRYMVYELLEAAKRGVQVKIIVDRWKSDNVSQLVAFMSSAHPKMEVKTYNPVAQKIKPSTLRLIPEVIMKFKKVNQRMHNKVFIIDGKTAITGGRNYENDYYDRGVKRNFKDRDILVIGPVVESISDSFMEYWNFELSISSEDLLDINGLMNSKKFEVFDSRESFRLNHLFDDTDRLANDFNHIQKVFIKQLFPVKKVQFISDKPGKNDHSGLKGGSESAAELAKILFEAKHSIVAQTPYLVLDKTTVNGVKQLRKKNPDIDILISSNSLAATDNIYAYSFSYKQKKLFVQDLRFRIFEFKPVPKDIAKMMPRYSLNLNGHRKRGDLESVDSLFQQKDMNSTESDKRHLCVHAKSFVIDDHVAWIGSFNLDPRSVHLNTEVGLVIWDEVLAGKIKENILRDMSPGNSWTIGKRSQVPLISIFSELLGSLLEYIPVVDVWPFRYTASFKLKKGKEPVPFYDKRFYQHYTSVGSFPDVALSLKEVEVRLLKAFTGLAMPLI